MRRKKIAGLMVVVFLVSLVLVGCFSGESDIQDRRLVGMWEDIDGLDRIEFFADGHGEISDFVFLGQWSVFETFEWETPRIGELLISFDSGGTVWQEYEVAGQQLTLNDRGNSLEFVRVR